jgi:hypothetical protein
VRNTNDLAAGAERIAEESRAFYLLGFHPPAGKAPGEWRKLRVDLKRKGLKVRARRGYSLRAAGTVAKPAGKGERSRLPGVEGALDSAHDAAAIPLRVMAYVFEPRPKGTMRVVVAAELDAAQLTYQARGKTRVATIEASVVATHRDTGRTTRSDGRFEVRAGPGESPGWHSVALDLDLPAGVSQVRVVVHDPASHTIGSASQRFEVPRPGVLRLSTPILTDALARTPGDGGRPRPALAAHRGFRPEGRLYCEFEVFGASRSSRETLPRVSAGLELRMADGRMVREAPATPIAADPDGRVVRFVEMGLDGMEDGSYELVLKVRDEVGGGQLEQRESFRLAR